MLGDLFKPPTGPMGKPFSSESLGGVLGESFSVECILQVLQSKSKVEDLGIYRPGINQS